MRRNTNATLWWPFCRFSTRIDLKNSFPSTPHLLLVKLVSCTEIRLTPPVTNQSEISSVTQARESLRPNISFNLRIAARSKPVERLQKSDWLVLLSLIRSSSTHLVHQMDSTQFQLKLKLLPDLSYKALLAGVFFRNTQLLWRRRQMQDVPAGTSPIKSSTSSRHSNPSTQQFSTL